MQGGIQELVLGPSCLNFGTILHELLHALGFFHEHTRPDRDNYLEIYYENIQFDKLANFDRISPRHYRMVTEFDYESIMIYGERAFSSNGLQTMLPIEPFQFITNPQYKHRLSVSDIYALRKYYSCI